MPSPGSWITTALYFWGAYSCRATSIHLEVGSLEPLAWTAIAVLLALGFWLMGELKFFIPYKAALVHEYGTAF